MSTKKLSRSHRQAQSVGEESCLLQPSSSSSSASKGHQSTRKSKLTAAGFGDPGGAAASMPLLAVRDLTNGRAGYEMPPSYETACGSVADRRMAGDSAVCTITPSNPSAVAYHSYPAALQGIPDQLPMDPLYQNNAVRLMAPEWRCSSEEYGGHQGWSTGGKRNLSLSPTHMQAMQQCVVQGHQQPPGLHHHQQSHPDHNLVWQAPSHRRMHHYPTPPSQHSHGAAPTYDVGLVTGPGATARVPLPIPTGYHHPEQFLTPSPDSPGQWSSSSPHSGQSDWSEGISSPPQAATQQHQTTAANQRLSHGNSSSDAIFLVRT